MDLDDSRALQAAGGRLLALAYRGAEVRTLARELGSRPPVLHPEDVGACAVVGSDLLPAAATDTLALILRELGAPLAVALPVLEPGGRFPRAADVAVIVGVSGAEPALLDALRVAAGRGATVIVSAPRHSPLAAAAAERRCLLAQHDDGGEPDAAWWAALAGAVAAWRGTDRLPALADDLDQVAAGLGPVVPTYDNPAKQLAGLDGPLLLIAPDAAAAILGHALAGELGSGTERPVRLADARAGTAQIALLAAVQASGGPERDVFYDPQIDGPDGRDRPWQLVLLPPVRDTPVAEEAARAAAAAGAVLAPVIDRGDGEWTGASRALLAQMCGAYRTLYQREQE